MRKIIIIAAMGENKAIGLNNKLPWHIKAELKHFKEKTLGKTLIMGRKTFESLPNKSLVDREIISISRSGLSLKEALEQTENLEEVFIAGGAETYKEFLKISTHMILSIVANKNYINYKADTYFPEFDQNNWILEKTENKEGFKVRYYCAI